MIDLNQLQGVLKSSTKNLNDIVDILNGTVQSMDESQINAEQLKEIKITMEQTDDLLKKAPQMLKEVEKLIKKKR